MSTFHAALQRGVERVFQLEPSELAAEFLPNDDDPSRILFYEASEGGSGVLSRLVDEAQREVCFREIAKKALEVMHYRLDSATGGYEEAAGVKCQAGCYECLLSYHNQTEHGSINRRNPVVKDCLVALGTAADVARFVSHALAAEITSVFIHDSRRFTLSNEGDSNLYAVFTELVMHIRNPEGRVGLVVPAGICSDNSTQRLFAAMAKGKTLEAVLSFENEEFLFPAVHHSYKFALLTLGKAETTDFTFFN